MYRLLNAAMMPQPGVYSLTAMTPDEFGRAVRVAYEDGTLVSYIGYAQTADHISRLAGVPISASREQTYLVDRDVLLIIRLRYRVEDSAIKGAPVPEDFAFFRADYRCLPGPDENEASPAGARE